MKKRALLLTMAVLSAACSGGCSRLVQMYVRNHYPFPISVHERTVWRNTSWKKDSGIIAPQGVFPIDVSQGETTHLQMSDAKGKLLSHVTVSAATVQAAYWNDNEILVEVEPGQNSVILVTSTPLNASNNWRTCGLVTMVLMGALTAFRFWQKRM